MIGRLRLVGVGAVCLAMIAVVPGALAAPPASPGQPPVVADAAQGAAAVQSESLPGAPLNPYVPPACAGVFTDVACPGGFAVNWIEKFYADGITAGCNAAPLRYCPDQTVTRAQMAVFVEKAMRGTSPWTPGDLGNGNTGIGAGSLPFTATGADNTAVGLSSLAAATSGTWNTAVGAASLQHNTVGNANTAVGQDCLSSNTSASGNTAIGMDALHTQSYDPGSFYYSDNTAVGRNALFSNQPDGGNGGVNGTSNTAVGAGALNFNGTGRYNTAVGVDALDTNTTGFDNTAIGWKAGSGVQVVTGYGGSPVQFVPTQTGSYDTFIGLSGSTAEVNNCTAVGMDAYCDASDQVRLGNYFVNSIGGKVGFSALSDARAKTDIRDLDLGLDFVLALRPVSYHLKGGNGRTDMGFVAQDVEALLGDEYNVLGVGGDKERTLSLRHTDLIAPMVKAIQEQQAQIAGRDARIEALEARLAAIEARLSGK